MPVGWGTYWSEPARPPVKIGRPRRDRKKINRARRAGRRNR